MKIQNTYAGCSAKNKCMAITGKYFYYISSQNIICCTPYSVETVIFLDSQGNSINSRGSNIVAGDTQGNIYIISENRIVKKIFAGGSIQDCIFYNDNIIVFCTMDKIWVYDIVNDYKIEKTVNFLISSIALKNEILILGGNLGIIEIFCLEDGREVKSGYNTQIDSSYFNLNQINHTDQSKSECYTQIDSSFDLKHLERIDGHTDTIKDIKVSDSGLIATCSLDCNIKIWELNPKLTLLQTLNGHTDWVNEICWEDDVLHSASSDKTIRVWKHSELSVSSDNLKCFRPVQIYGGSSDFLGVRIYSGRILGQCKTGGIDNVDESEYFISGHLNEVTDLDWNKNILLSSSLDETARIFYKGKECGRPQIHGYSISTVKFLPSERLRFISGAHETIMRIYEATRKFLKNCEIAQETVYEDSGEEDFLIGDSKEYEASAILSELNLTNEVVQEYEEDNISENSLSSSVFKEVLKVYGHYFEIKNIAVGKNIILSCNKSMTKKFAGLFVWDIDGNKIQYLEEHDLGIQRISIDPYEKYALTVSRDKTSCLYRIDNKKLSVIKRFYDHERIIWDCGFSYDGKFFATCSRDGKIIFYDILSLQQSFIIKLEREVISIAFSPKEDLFAVGLDNGIIKIYKNNICVDEERVTGKKVNVLKFNMSGTRLAVGGSDGLIRTISIC